MIFEVFGSALRRETRSDGARKRPGYLLLLLVALAALTAGMLWTTGTSGSDPGSGKGVAAPPHAGKSSDWWGQVQRDIMDGEYHITWQSQTQMEDLQAAWHAPNRAHGFRIYFTDEGIRVIPRTEPRPSWEWSLRLVGYGRAGTWASVNEATVSTHENRIDYDRGDIVEWYINDQSGLEQGFMLYAPPAEPASKDGAATGGSTRAGIHGPHSREAEGGSPLYVFLELAGTLSPVISMDGQAIDFVTPAGVKVVHFAKLSVRDSRGVELEAWMEGFNDGGMRGIRIAVSDLGAAFPITVDPLATSPAWTAESDQASARFGASVATAGDIDDDGYTDVIVGASRYDNGTPDEGQAFLYRGTPSGLSSIPSWTVEANNYDARLGTSVATAGDVNCDGYADVIIGSPGFTNGSAAEGRAFVYHGSPSGLPGVPDGGGIVRAGPAHADWMKESNQAYANFGHAVATAGDVNGDGCSDVIVGAYAYDNGETNEGMAFNYHGSPSGLLLVPYWMAEGDQAGAWFGVSVATAGDVNGDGYADVIVGASQYDRTETDEGRAFIFRGSASGLTHTGWNLGFPMGHSIHMPPVWPAQAGATFGRWVGTAGDVNGDGFADVIVGAPLFDPNGGPIDAGAALIYISLPEPTGMTLAWRVKGDQAGAHFGRAVGTAGDINGDGYADVVVGAPGYDNDETIDAGRVFVYHLKAAGLPVPPNWTVEGDQAGAQLGNSVATAGDVNGDGFSDLIVGAYLHDNGQTDEGAAFVYHGSYGGLSEGPTWHEEGPENTFTIGSHLGYSVATAGDVNGDGQADVIVGAPLFDNGELLEGRVYVYYGGGFGAWTAEGDEYASGFGTSVATAGDVNGDGYSDVIIGAPYADPNDVTANEGRVYVYHGSEQGLRGVPDGIAQRAGSDDANWTAESNSLDAEFGTSVATAGDFNGDGYSDVIVGAPGYDNGKAFVYHGSLSGLPGVPDDGDVVRADPGDASWTRECDQAVSRFGASVATAGDVNRDGYSDVIVGAPDYDNGETDEGRAHVFFSPYGDLWMGDYWTAESDQDGAHFGHSVATAGDVDGDGYTDVIVGAPYYDDFEADEGMASVFHGMYGGLPGELDDSFVIRADLSDAYWIRQGNQSEAHFGYSVATAGDVNGDGFADVIVGAPAYHNGGPVPDPEGTAFVYHGSSSGLSTAPDWTALHGQASARFGWSVSTAGDLTGDGYADVIIGAPGYDNLQEEQGAVYIYQGNDGPGVSLLPRQRTTADTRMISLLGSSDSPEAFRLAIVGRTPYGRGGFRPEFEIKELGSLFNAANIETLPNYWDTGVHGNDLGHVIAGLTEESVYHWRVRLRYNPASTPFQQRSRWLTMPWNGWQEADLRTLSAGTDADADGYTILNDCDDTNNAIFPGAPQLCDGLNNDCDDVGWPVVSPNETDDDGDGYVECDPWVGGDPAVTDGADCDDTNPTRYPGAPEINDGIDNQCPGDRGYGLIDEFSGGAGFPDPGMPDRFSWPSQAGATSYEAARSTSPDFSTGCEKFITTETHWEDTTAPLQGEILHYLCRPLTPYPGSWGANSARVERTDICP